MPLTCTNVDMRPALSGRAGPHRAQTAVRELAGMYADGPAHGG